MSVAAEIASIAVCRSTRMCGGRALHAECFWVLLAKQKYLAIEGETKYLKVERYRELLRVIAAQLRPHLIKINQHLEYALPAGVIDGGDRIGERKGFVD